ncbi:hypothetical protein GCM10027318_00070 [Massilia agilis]|nr:hypothetical protein [Massilia solisilvae]
MRPLLRLTLVAALLPALGGCMAMAVGGAVVGGAVTVAGTAVDAGVAVGKGAVNVATYPFRSSDSDNTKK